MVNEKLKYFEQLNPEFLKNVCEVVVDELGIISEKSRGPQLEIAITGLLQGSYKPAVLVLTTPLEISEQLLKHMGGFLLETQERPIDIRAGVWNRQSAEFQSWSCNTLKPHPPEKWDLDYPSNIDKTFKELVLRYQKGIMFAVPSKALALSYANRLSQLINRDQEVKKVILGRDHSTKSIEDRLKGLEPTRNKLLLNEYLKNGIAFHHAELTVQERREVEDAFRNMEICVLFCTSTLARGINVPANVVVFLGWGGTVNFGEQTYPSQVQLFNEFNNWMGRIGRPGNETFTKPVAIYLAQTTSETNYIKRLIFANKVLIHTRLADADVDLTPHLLSACSSISNCAVVKAKSGQQDHVPYLFSLQDIREFFSSTPSAANENLKRLILYRTTNCLVSLVNPQKDTTFVNLRKLTNKLLYFGTATKNQSISISGWEIIKLICDLENLPYLNMNIIKEMKTALRNSIVQSFQNNTLFELARIFHNNKDIHQIICWMIAEIQRVDKHQLARKLGEFGELLKQDDVLGSIPWLKQRIEKLTWQITYLVEHELENIHGRKDLNWLNLIRVCQLNRQLLVELESLLETDEFLGKLLHSSEGNFAISKNLPRYLNCIEAGGKQGFELTNFGKICCSYGISTKTCDQLYKWLGTGMGNGKVLEIYEEDFFRLLLCTFDGALVRLMKMELPWVKTDLVLGKHEGDRSQLFLYRRKDLTITCLALKDWIEGMPTIEIEEKYGLWCGSLYEVSRQVSRLIRACREIARNARKVFESDIQITVNLRKSASSHQIPYDLGELADMVLYGLPLEALPIAYLRVEGLTRSWIMNLVHFLNKQGIGEGLTTIERLQLLSDEQLKGILPTRGLQKRLKEALGKNGMVPLAKNLANDREFLLRYYLLPQVIKAQLERGKQHYGGQNRFMALRVVTGDGDHTVLRRNNINACQPIIIRNEQELIEWVKGGAIDFYGEIGEFVPCEIVKENNTSLPKSTKYIVDRFFVDLDPQNGFPMDRLKAITQNIYEFFVRTPQVGETKIYWTGGKGFHIIGFFKEGIQLDVQLAKDKLIALLNSWRICNDVDIFMGQDPTVLEPYLTIDLSSIMRRGIYRNELSIHAKSGGVCLEVKNDELKNFNPLIEAKPETVLYRLIGELTQEEKNIYNERVYQLMSAMSDKVDSFPGYMMTTVTC
jgi:replicative superfamily II helicase